MTHREALIEEAAKAMYFEDCGVAALEDDAEPFREMARVALAVFEQAHTPTDDEREAAKAEALSRWPLDPSDGEGSHAVKTAMRIGFKEGADWAALRRPVQGEPTERERELERTIADLGDELRISRERTDAALEVMNRHRCGEQAEAAYRRALRAESRAQGEPTDAQVYAAMEAYCDYRESDGPGDAMRAALRAAFAVTEQGEPSAVEFREHGVEHLLVWAQDYARRGEPLKSAALIEAARELLAVQGEPTAFEKRHADHEHVGPYCMPQGELTDAQVLAALTRWFGDHERTTYTPALRDYAPSAVEDMRAALRTAAAVTEQGVENR